AYRGHRTSAVLAMLDSDSPAGFLHTAATMQYLTWRDDREIHDLLEARRQYSRQRDELTAEIAVAEQQLAEIAKRKLELEKALGHPSPAGGFSGGSPSATPAPRNPNGTWPRESCSQKDPTSTGCLTPRTLHALQEA